VTYTTGPIGSKLAGMKLKCIPADFEVEEILSPIPEGGGYAYYRLSKCGLGTPEAIQAIHRKWNLPRGCLAFAGLKDRHATTQQYVTIDGGPPRGFAQESFSLEYLGQVRQPVHASQIVANRFSVVVRDIASHADPAQDEGTQLQKRFEQAATVGVPNYFDQQRFGSLGKSKEWIAVPWCQGNFERAVWLMLADANERDSAVVREEKKQIRGQWGKWGKMVRSVQDRTLAPAIRFLADSGGDFRRTLGFIRPDLRSIYLAAFQSTVWNGMLDQIVAQAWPDRVLPSIFCGDRSLRLFPDQVLNAPELANMLIPLPSARLHLEENEAGAKMGSLIESVLSPYGLAMRELRVKYPRDSFFSKGERPATFRPTETGAQMADDDLYPGRKKLTLRFHLPRGSYATILVRQMLAGLADADSLSFSAGETPEDD